VISNFGLISANIFQKKNFLIIQKIENYCNFITTKNGCMLLYKSCLYSFLLKNEKN